MDKLKKLFSFSNSSKETVPVDDLAEFQQVNRGFTQVRREDTQKEWAEKRFGSPIVTKYSTASEFSQAVEDLHAKYEELRTSELHENESQKRYLDQTGKTLFSTVAESMMQKPIPDLPLEEYISRWEILQTLKKEVPATGVVRKDDVSSLPWILQKLYTYPVYRNVDSQIQSFLNQYSDQISSLDDKQQSQLDTLTHARLENLLVYEVSEAQDLDELKIAIQHLAENGLIKLVAEGKQFFAPESSEKRENDNSFTFRVMNVLIPKLDRLSKDFVENSQRTIMEDNSTLDGVRQKYEDYVAFVFRMDVVSPGAPLARWNNQIETIKQETIGKLLQITKGVSLN